MTATISKIIVNLPTQEQLDTTPGPELDYIEEEYLDLLFPNGMERTFYKVFSPEMSSPIHRSDIKYTVGEWAPFHVDPEICEHGIHITTDPYTWLQRPGTIIRKVEAKGVLIDGIDKYCHPYSEQNPKGWKISELTSQKNKLICSTVKPGEEITVEQAHEIHKLHLAADRERADARAARLAAIRAEELAQRYAAASLNARIFVPNDIDAKKFLTSFMQHQTCPHCNYEVNSFVMEEEIRTYGYETRTKLLNTDGKITEDYGDYETTDSETEDYTIRYGCGGQGCEVESYDFEDLLEFEDPYQNFYDFVREALEGY